MITFLEETLGSDLALRCFPPWPAECLAPAPAITGQPNSSLDTTTQTSLYNTLVIEDALTHTMSLQYIGTMFVCFIA